VGARRRAPAGAAAGAPRVPSVKDRSEKFAGQNEVPSRRGPPGPL